MSDQGREILAIEQSIKRDGNLGRTDEKEMEVWNELLRKR